MNSESEDFVSHYGTKGMRWGVRKDAPTIASSLGLTRGKTPRDSSGEIKKPSYFRTLFAGTYANSKDRYTDPFAREQRTNAGKVALAGSLTALGGAAISTIGSRTSSANGAAMVGGFVQQIGGTIGLAGVAYGVVANATERRVRNERAENA